MASEYLTKYRRSLRLACADVAKCDPDAAQCSAADCALARICPRWVPALARTAPIIHRPE